MKINVTPPRARAEPVCDTGCPDTQTGLDTQQQRRFAGETKLTAYNQDIADVLECMLVNHVKNHVVKADRDDTR